MDDLDLTPDVPYVWPHQFHFLTGPAGCGKTFLTRERIRQAAPGTCVLMASTGIAAVNLGDAVTINSQLGYFDTASMEQALIEGRLQTRLRRLRQTGVRRLILDEISMVEAPQLTCLMQALDDVNGEAPVLQDPKQQLGLTLVGDFLQLPPVKGKFAFESPAWSRFEVETLTENKRQDDPDFIEALRAARTERGDLVVEYFRDRLHRQMDLHYDGTTILAKNLQVDRMNQMRHNSLPGEPELFESTRWGKERSEWKQIPPSLALKPGARVMILANRYEDIGGERALVYANGSLGTFQGKNPQGDAQVILEDGTSTRVLLVTRQNEVPRPEPIYVCLVCGQQAEDGRSKRCVVEIDSRTIRDAAGEERTEPVLCNGSLKKVTTEVIGEISYIPLRLAYASTVHKTQGLTLDKVQINIADPFFTAPGMLYVALSRARNPQELVVIGTPEMLRARCRMDPRVAAWR